VDDRSVLPTVPDVLGPEWVARIIPLPPDDEGEVVATLVSHAAGPRHGRAVLFVHGYVDYFFQAEHARHWIDHGYDFYALDLRKHGRSLLPHQTPNYVRDIRAFGAEIAAAVRLVRAEHPGNGIRVVLLGASTGGLYASLWAHAHPGAVDAVVLNSPWFDHRGPWRERVLLTRASEVLGTIAPRTPLGGIKPHYGRALHAATGGAWDYNLAWKPHEGFPARAAWVRSVRRGHRRVHRGLSIQEPVLVCASARNGPTDRVSPALADSDCVLDVDDMVRYAPRLGPDVTVVRVEGGIHDLALSAPPARAEYENAVFEWLEKQVATHG
jgi:alpha-beta hydrolase superfamily lysophospholipase